MLISCDRTNFPLVAVDEAAVEVHLLPVTKIQFERFTAEASGVDEAQYQEMLALNPTVSPEIFTADNREQLFVTGILPDEALAYARWLGEGFDLPTSGEWRAVLAALQRVPPPRRQQLTDFIDGDAGLIVDELSHQLYIRTMADFTLLQGGLVEWVRHEEHLVGLGAPRPEFHPNLWDPLVNVVKPLQLDERLPYFGFRLVRRGDWYLAEKDKASYVF
jgi:hypothetical protein